MRCTIILCMILLAVQVVNAWKSSKQVTGHLKHYEVASIHFTEASDGKRLRKRDEVERQLRLTVKTPTTDLPLVLTQNNILEHTSFGTNVTIAKAMRYYEATVQDDPESDGRVALIGTMMQGYVRTNNITFHFEVVRSSLAGASSNGIVRESTQLEMIVYQETDIFPEGKNLPTCMHKKTSKPQAFRAPPVFVDLQTGQPVTVQAYVSYPSANDVAGITNKASCALAIILDGAFVTYCGGRQRAIEYALTTYNAAEGIIKRNTGVSMPLVFLDISDDSQSPLAPQPNDPNEFLDRVRRLVIEKQTQMPNVCSAIVFSHHAIPDNLGLAFTGVDGFGMCNRQGYNVAMALSNNAGEALSLSQWITTVAHELLHTLGAAHDGEDPTAPAECQVGSDPNTWFIMSPRTATGANADKTSPCSNRQIAQAISSGGGCLFDPGYIKQQEECRQRAGHLGITRACRLNYDRPLQCALLCQDPDSEDRCVGFVSGNSGPLRTTSNPMCNIIA